MVIDGENDDPLFSLLDHLLSLAAYDDAFEAKSARQVENIFWVTMPLGKKSLTLKWKRDVLDLPVFREPLRGAAGTGTSPTEPLRASTWIRYLKRLGKKAGFQYSFTQYGLRRGLLNVVNSMFVPVGSVSPIRTLSQPLIPYTFNRKGSLLRPGSALRSSTGGSRLLSGPRYLV